MYLLEGISYILFRRCTGVATTVQRINFDSDLVSSLLTWHIAEWNFNSLLPIAFNVAVIATAHADPALESRSIMHTSTDIVTTPCSGTAVWLHSLTDVRRNGQIALVMRESDSSSMDAAAHGRCAVQMLKDDSILSVRLCKLSLSPPAFFCIKEAPGTGGLGVYATQDIEAGVPGRNVAGLGPYNVSSADCGDTTHSVPIVNTFVSARVYIEPLGQTFCDHEHV